MPSSAGSNHRYENLTLSGHATAVQGNIYGDTYEIYVLAQDYVGRSHPQAFAVSRTALPTSQRTAEHTPYQVTNLVQKLQNLLQGSGSPEKARLLPPIQPRQQNDAKRKVTHLEDSIDGVLRKLRELLMQSAQLPSQEQHRSQAGVARIGPVTATVVILLAFIQYQNVSATLLGRILTRIHDDSFTHLILLIVACWCTNVFSRSSPTKTVAETSGDCFVFEDAYKIQCNIPLAYLASQSILKGFLQHHYQDSSAAKLVEAGSFYFMLGNRFCSPVTMSRLCSGTVAKNHTVVMSIRYRARSIFCIECTNKLNPRQGSDYSCSYCRRAYCIRETVWTPSVSLNTAAFLQPKSRLETWTFWTGSLDGLQNIDLDVFPKAQSRKKEPRTVHFLHSPKLFNPSKQEGSESRRRPTLFIPKAQIGSRRDFRTSQMISSKSVISEPCRRRLNRSRDQCGPRSVFSEPNGFQPQNLRAEWSEFDSSESDDPKPDRRQWPSNLQPRISRYRRPGPCRSQIYDKDSSIPPQYDTGVEHLRQHPNMVDPRVQRSVLDSFSESQPPLDSYAHHTHSDIYHPYITQQRPYNPHLTCRRFNFASQPQADAAVFRPRFKWTEHSMTRKQYIRLIGPDLFRERYGAIQIKRSAGFASHPRADRDRASDKKSVSAYNVSDPWASDSTVTEITATKGPTANRRSGTSQQEDSTTTSTCAKICDSEVIPILTTARNSHDDGGCRHQGPVEKPLVLLHS